MTSPDPVGDRPDFEKLHREEAGEADGEAVERIYIARCPEHGLHGERQDCFVCSGPVEQVEVVPAGAVREQRSWEAWVCDVCPNISDAPRGSINATCAGSVTLGTDHEPAPMRRVRVGVVPFVDPAVVARELERERDEWKERCVLDGAELLGRAERAERAADALRQELEQAHDLMNALSAVPITARGEDFDPLIRRARDLLAEHGEKGDDGVD